MASHSDIEHIRKQRRKALKRALMWRSLGRTGGRGHTMIGVCEEQRKIEWSNVRYWVQAELYRRGQ